MESSGCTSDNDCSDHGLCQDSICECSWFWTGDDCSTRWQDAHPGFLEFFIFYSALTVLLNLFIVCKVIYEYTRIRKFQTNIVTVCFGLLLVASLSIVVIHTIRTNKNPIVRIWYFSFDSHRYREVITVAEDYLYFYIPIIIWFFVLYLVLLQWYALRRAIIHLTNKGSNLPNLPTCPK